MFQNGRSGFGCFFLGGIMDDVVIIWANIPPKTRVGNGYNYSESPIDVPTFDCSHDIGKVDIENMKLIFQCVWDVPKW
jgi:hypothetical protein